MLLELPPSKTILFQATSLATEIQNSKHAAAIYYKTYNISLGVNSRKSHPLMKKFQNKPEKIYLHAEVDAIIKAVKKFSLDECTLFVLRQTRSGKIGLSKPCRGCQKTIRAFGLKEVYYSTEADEWEKL